MMAEEGALRAAVAKVAVTLCLYEEEPNEKGQKSFNGCLMDSVAMDLVALVYPLREMCRHQIDEQAGCCRKCGIYVEDIPVGIANAGE